MSEYDKANAVFAIIAVLLIIDKLGDIKTQLKRIADAVEKYNANH